MPEDRECCADPGCGCQTTAFPTGEKCPDCGERLRLSGQSQLVNFRLTCRHCGYQSPLLTQEELQVLL